MPAHLILETNNNFANQIRTKTGNLLTFNYYLIIRIEESVVAIAIHKIPKDKKEEEEKGTITTNTIIIS